VQTLPVEQRSRGIAISYSGGSLGALIAPIVVTPIAARWGWTGAFWFTGAVGAVWLGIWALVSRRKDLREHHNALPGGRASGEEGIKWRDSRLWAFLAAYALGGFPAAFVLYQSSIYLSAVMHFSQTELGRVLWIPPLGWEVGYFFWGWVTDRFAAAGGSIPAMRRQFLVLALLSVPLAAVTRVGSAGAALGLMFLAMFIAAGFIIGAVAYATSHYSMRHAGLIAGLGAGSWSAVVAVIMPGAGKLFDLHAYHAAFEAATMVPIAGYFIWRALNRSIS
jgi:ACS family hexuronate transporter-like MFS transporter